MFGLFCFIFTTWPLIIPDDKEFKKNCLERHSLCTEANWGLPTQHFQKGIIVWVSIKNIKNKKKRI